MNELLVLAATLAAILLIQKDEPSGWSSFYLSTLVVILIIAILMNSFSMIFRGT